ncbi:MAG TPA: ABC transporter ATP-binding protein [Acidimicrobiales bacterium]|nr:ABC transporter ATP-binding protein [Acidimicrobiales bacterium]
MPAVEAVGLCKRYGDVTAVDRLDLSIDKGEIFGLLGPNGAGKTTTILMLLGLTEPTAGKARVDGLDATRAPLEVKRRVGYLPDDVGFYSDLTGRDNLRYTAQLNRLPKEVAEERIEHLLHDVGLTDAADRRVSEYSRGMRQRLGLADALVKRPSLLILDEPTVNIDPEGVREILELVRGLRDREGTTVLISSHLLHQVEQICDRVGIFVKGRLAALGTIDELVADVQGGYSIEIDLEGEGDPRAVLEEVDGVTEVEQTLGGWLARSNRDVRDDVIDACRAAGFSIARLVGGISDLDAVYHTYFGGADGFGGAHGDDHS